MPNELWLLLQAVQGNPDDESLRLALADYLEEHGPRDSDRDRGALIRTHLAQAECDPEDPRRQQLEDVADDLLERHRRAWLGPLEQLADRHDTFGPLLHTEIWAGTLSLGIRFDLLREAARRAPEQLAWLTQLRVWDLVPGDLPALLRWPFLGQVSDLDLSDGPYGDEEVARLVRSPRLTNVVYLELSNSQVGARGVHAILTSKHLPRLKELRLYECWLDDEAFGILARSPRLASLSFLAVGGNPCTAAGRAELLASPHVAGVQLAIDDSDPVPAM
jgi:uncharacterized protein (TIGR02996 family)